MARPFLVNKKFTRLRRDDASLVLMEVSFDEREMLIEAEPQTRYTAHYKDYPCAARGEPAARSATSWNMVAKIAPKKLVKNWARRGSERLGRAALPTRQRKKPIRPNRLAMSSPT